MKTFIQLTLYGIIWLLVLIIEVALLFSGLVAQGHDKPRLVMLALAAVCLPVIGYGLHRAVIFLFSGSGSGQPEAK